MIHGKDGLSKLRKKHLKKAEEAREKLKLGGMLQSFAFVRKDGSYSIHNDMPCLMQVPHNSEPGDLFFIDRSIRRMPFEDCEKYIHYVLNESYWRHVFVTKDAREAYDKGVICKTNYPARYVLTGTIALRFIYEWEYMIQTWNKLRSLFNNGDFCLLMAHHLGVENDSLIRGNGPGNHPMFTYYPSDELIFSILKSDYNWLKGQPLFSESGRYRPLTTSMPGGKDSNFNFPTELGGKRVIENVGKNTLGLHFKFQTVEFLNKKEVEKAWVDSVLKHLEEGLKKHEVQKRVHCKPEPGIRKSVRLEWIDDILAAGNG